MYFNKFPYVKYKFGSENSETLFQDLSAYTEVIDSIKDDINFYSKYYIQDGERPDILSQKLYGTPDFYWTFFLMNDGIREGGWPMDSREIVIKNQTDHPHTTLTTKAQISNKLLAGQTVIGSTSGATGVISQRRVDFGQLNVSLVGTTQFIATETIYSNVVDRFGFDQVEQVDLVAASKEYNSVHHYEDVDGNYVDVDPLTTAPSEISAFTILVTFADRIAARNEAIKSISIVRPSAIKSVNKAFNDSMRSF